MFRITFVAQKIFNRQTALCAFRATGRTWVWRIKSLQPVSYFQTEIRAERRSELIAGNNIEIFWATKVPAELILPAFIRTNHCTRRWMCNYQISVRRRWARIEGIRSIHSVIPFPRATWAPFLASFDPELSKIVLRRDYLSCEESAFGGTLYFFSCVLARKIHLRKRNDSAQDIL